jgi:hypothetical protein
MLKFHGKLLWFLSLPPLDNFIKPFTNLLPFHGIGMDPIMTEKYLIALSQELRLNFKKL